MFGLDSLLITGLSLTTLVLQLWALIDCVTRPSNAFEAAGKLSKPAWLAITALAVLLGRFGLFGIFGLAAIVASIVYLVDVRPAVREVQGGGNRY